MEKISFQIWKKSTQADAEFKSLLLDDLHSLLLSKVSELQINLVDADVKAAKDLVQSSSPPSPHAIIFLKAPSYFYLSDLQKFFEDNFKKFYGYIISESCILEDPKPSAIGTRTDGFSQIVFLGKPDSMDEFSWFEHWVNVHTQIAIDTQSNFIYTQNSIVRPLQEDSPPFIAIIEECFPEEAMISPEVFYGASGNPKLLAKNLEIMMGSCAQFIDFNNIEVIPTSRYRMI